MDVQRLSKEDFGVLRNPGATSVQLVWGRNAPDALVTVTRVTLEPGARQELHAHPASEQTWIIESGAATMLLDRGRTLLIKAGDVLRTPPGRTHGLVNGGAEPLVYLTITVPPQDFTAVYATT